MIRQPLTVPESKFIDGQLLPCRYNYFFTVIFPAYPGFISPKAQHVIGTDYQISAEMVQSLIRKYLDEIITVMDRGNLEVVVGVPLINKAIPALTLPEGSKETFTYYSMTKEKLDKARESLNE